MAIRRQLVVVPGQKDENDKLQLLDVNDHISVWRLEPRSSQSRVEGGLLQPRPEVSLDAVILIDFDCSLPTHCAVIETANVVRFELSVDVRFLEAA